MPSRPKRPRDPAQLAKLIIDIASGEIEDVANVSNHDKNPAAVALGRLGANAAAQQERRSFHQKRRKEIAKKAAAKRWAAKVEKDE